ncbi:MAG TPA: flagellar biosynthetic protein FliR [Alphaproteobacteria bacterium]|nr:flagellar biosynthetic protein FliR [Alphaproteobacteria bacterium]
MNSIDLDRLLSGHVFAFLLILSRIVAVMLLFPGIGESYVPARLRMMVGVVLSFLLMEPLMPIIPPPPADTAELARMIVGEFVIGMFFGSFLRVALSALETAGAVAAMQTGLSNATILNPALASESPLPSAFYSIVGVTLIFVTGLDHMLIRAMIQTYDIFPPGAALIPGDMAKTFVNAVNKSFVFGIELTAPFMVAGLLMFIALGVMQRLLPQVSVFLVALPAQVWGGLFLMATTVTTIMAVWLAYFDHTVAAFLNP